MKFLSRQDFLAETTALQNTNEGLIRFVPDALKGKKHYELDFEASGNIAECVFVRRFLESFAPYDRVGMLVTESGVWEHREDKTLLAALRLFHGESAPIVKKPGLICEGEGVAHIASFVLLALLFDWDFMLVFQFESRATSLAEFSHDGWARIHIPTISEGVEALARDYGAGLTLAH